jgi:hypothetical protein
MFHKVFKVTTVKITNNQQRRRKIEGVEKSFYAEAKLLRRSVDAHSCKVFYPKPIVTTQGCRLEKVCCSSSPKGVAEGNYHKGVQVGLEVAVNL